MKNSIKNLYFYSAAMFMAVFLPLSSFSQQPQDIFSMANWTAGSLVGEQQVRYGKLLAEVGGDANDLQPIVIGDLSQMQYNGKLVVSVGDDQCGSVVFNVRHSEYISENDYLWYAEIESADSVFCLKGHLLLQSKNGQKYGLMQMEDNYYRIEDLTGGKNILAKYPPLVQGSVCEAESLTPPTQITGDGVQERGGNCDVRVLVLFTNSAFDATANPVGLANSSINLTNQVLLNSDIHSPQLKLVLAGVETLNYDETGLTFLQVIGGVPASGIGSLPTNPEAQAFRVLHDADLVVLFANRSIMANGGGIAFVGPTNFSAYAVVQSFASNQSFIFSHEVGHQFGARHEPCEAEDPGPNCCRTAATPPMTGELCGTLTGSERGHTWSFQTRVGVPFPIARIHKRKTVMYSSTNDDAVAHFSNPDVLKENLPTGIANQRDNAEVLLANSCTVANFNNLTSSINAGISGATVICDGGTTDLSAHVSGVPGPYTYKWYQSSNPTSYGAVKGTGIGYTVASTGFNPGNTIFIKMEATATSSGQVANAFHQLTVVGVESPDCYQFGPGSGNTNLLIVTSPNPASGLVSIEFDVEKEGRARIDLVDFSGKGVKGLADGYFEEGRHRLQFDVSGHSPGIYLVRYFDGRRVATGKVIVQKN